MVLATTFVDMYYFEDAAARAVGRWASAACSARP
jgi:hypothetical protein